jgi:nucleoside-diphosphate-sugar epimerase
MNRICITGASGYLGGHICSGLIRPGYDLICVDMVLPSNNYGEFRQADLRDEEQTRKAFEGSDIIIHCASIHPWKKYTSEQYMDMNVKATWNIFQMASELGIKKVILTSSIAATGYNPELTLCPVDESYQKQALGDIYSITKLFQEQIARHFCVYKGLRVIALRPPNFTPKPPIQTGAALISGCLLVEDMAIAHIKAVEVWEKLQNSFEPFFITPVYPYSKEETRNLSHNPKAVVEKYYPGVWNWFEEKGIKLNPVPTQYDNSKARRILGWEPERTFNWWWESERKNL